MKIPTQHPVTKEDYKLFFGSDLWLHHDFPEGIAPSQLFQADNGLIVIYDERPFGHPERFVTLVPDLAHNEWLLIHRFDVERILTIVQVYPDPLKAMQALRNIIPPAYTPEEITIYRAWDQENLQAKQQEEREGYVKYKEQQTK